MLIDEAELVNKIILMILVNLININKLIINYKLIIITNKRDFQVIFFN